MYQITPLSNAKIKELCKLHLKKYRDEQNIFIAEGPKVLEEALTKKIKILNIFALKSFKTNCCTENITYISESDMKKISTTSSVCEVLIIAEKTKSDFISGNTLILLDRISDPGNLGTIIRSASGFKADGIILFGDCVELYSPKVIRSSAGNFFKIPIISIKNINELKNKFKDYTFISTALRKNNNISIEDLKKLQKKIIMFGSEAQGLNAELINSAKYNILLKMAKDVESLNLSVSASIIMYELM